jgi:hypothetical protein
LENVKGLYHMGKLGVSSQVNVKNDFKIECEGVCEMEAAGPVQDLEETTRGHENLSFSSLKDWELLIQLSDYRICCTGHVQYHKAI